MKLLRSIALALVVVAAFAAGIAAGRRFGPKRRAAAPPTDAPTNAHELTTTLAQADALYRQGDLDAAAAHYEAALQYAPNDAALHIKAALVYEADGRKHKALVHLLAALKADPDHAEAHYQAARILAGLGRGAYPQALGQAQRAKELGYPVPDSLWQQLEELREENERATREGRPTPDNPMAGLGVRPGRPDLRQHPR